MTDIFDLLNLNDIPPELRQQLTVERVWNQEKQLQDAITMRKKGYTYKQIALHLGCTKQNVHKRLQLAKPTP